MNPWTLESNSGSSLIVAGASCVLGALLWLGTGSLSDATSTTVVAARWLGGLLFLIGLGCGFHCLLFAPRRTVLVDTEARCVHVDDSTRFRTRRRTFSFDVIEDVDVDAQGDNEGGSIRYNVALKPAGGKPVLLHMTGSWDEAAMRDLCWQVKSRTSRV